MLLHPPCEDLHLSFHMRNASELPTGCFPVDYAVHMPVNRPGIAEFNKHFSDRTYFLNPSSFAWIAGTGCTFPFSGTFAVPVRPFCDPCTGPAAAYPFLLMCLDCAIGDKPSQIFA
jgi:hypothetical protein